MHSLPDDFDVSPLLGTEFRQICLDRYQIQLHFENSSIQGGGKVCLELDGQSTEIFHETWKTGRGLEMLIGTQVVSWARRSDHQFSLTFSSGAALVFEVEEGPYEDFMVKLGNQALWVV
jgi:hypothetical protein